MFLSAFRLSEQSVWGTAYIQTTYRVLVCSVSYLCGCQVSCAPLPLKYGEFWGHGSASIPLWRWVCSLEPGLSAQLDTQTEKLEMIIIDQNGC